MKIVLLAAFVALATADVSHLINQGYHYENPAPQNAPQSSYGVPQSSVLGSSVQPVSGSGSVPQLVLPSSSGSSVGFSSVGSLPASGLSIQSYNSFSGSVPSSEGIHVAAPTPNVDLSGFQASSSPSAPSVNLVQYSQPSQPSSSFQFLSQLGNGGVSSSQFGSDASLNSGFGGGSSASQVSSGSSGFGVAGFGGSSQVSSVSSDSGLSGFVSSSGSAGSSQVSSNFVGGRTSGGSLHDAFGVVTDAAGGASGVNQQAAEVSKHLYFFDAPEEEEEQVQPKIELPPVPPKKSYKIIFIKAPTYRNQATITIPAPPQNEEKTLVYVLVKKPEGQPQVKFQSAAPTQPSKPEVFFIKYKTQQEAEAAVAEIQSKHGASGQVIANLPAGSHLAASLQSGSGVSERGHQSLPDSASFENRISEVASEGDSGSSQSGPSEESSSAGHVGVSGSVVNVGQGAVSPTPVTFGQNSVDSLRVFGGGIAPAAGSSESSSVTFESSSTVESGGQQEESGAAGSSDSGASSSDSSSAEVTVSGGSQESNVSQNVIEQRIGGADSDSQGSQIAGFSSYGPPKF